MTRLQNIPEDAYGILQKDSFDSELEEVAEQVKRLGYATLDSGLTMQELRDFSDTFESTRKKYILSYGKNYLEEIDEINTIRAPLTLEKDQFLKLLTNTHLLSVLRKLISGDFILNQQNGIINPPGKTYNQSAWHRDLPYQHFVSNVPLAVNALFCIDDFTSENGATFVLPASHKEASFPSSRFIDKNTIQVQAKAGQFILLDCMLFHSGGFNSSNQERRAVNHVFTIPYFKQQINISKALDLKILPKEVKQILGFNFQEPESIEQYLMSRASKTST